MTGDTIRFQMEVGQLLMGRMASHQVRSMGTIANLQQAEFRVSSQFGNDGIIDWLIERLEIPREAHSFIEFGVENYREANTRFLLQNRNWRGLVLDSSSAMKDAIHSDGLAARYEITTKTAFITRENINDLIGEAGFRGQVGLLSVDIDGNDYWVWEAIHIVDPIIVITEFNAMFGDIHPVSVLYDPAFVRTDKHYSGVYFGASLPAFHSLAEKKGYRFVGTNSAGLDAFFVKEEYARKLENGVLGSILALPSRIRDSRNADGQLNFIGGLDRIQQIDSMPVVDVSTGNVTAISALGAMYSSDWTKWMKGNS